MILAVVLDCLDKLTTSKTGRAILSQLAMSAGCVIEWGAEAGLIIRCRRPDEIGTTYILDTVAEVDAFTSAGGLDT